MLIYKITPLAFGHPAKNAYTLISCAIIPSTYYGPITSQLWHPNNAPVFTKPFSSLPLFFAVMNSWNIEASIVISKLKALLTSTEQLRGNSQASQSKLIEAFCDGSSNALKHMQELISKAEQCARRWWLNWCHCQTPVASPVLQACPRSFAWHMWRRRIVQRAFMLGVFCYTAEVMCRFGVWTRARTKPSHLAAINLCQRFTPKSDFLWAQFWSKVAFNTLALNSQAAFRDCSTEFVISSWGNKDICDNF